jgi:hypothetical protein
MNFKTHEVEPDVFVGLSFSRLKQPDGDIGLHLNRPARAG